MSDLTIGEIAERNMQGEELNSMWYLRAIETAICALSKCPSACDELLYQLGHAYEELEAELDDEAHKKICAERYSNTLPTVCMAEELIRQIVPVTLEGLHSVAPKLKAEDLTAAITKAFQAAGVVEVMLGTPVNNLSDRAGVKEAT